MGIYDQGVGFKFAFGESKRMLYILAIVLAILVVGAVAFFAMQNYEPSALEFRFEKNPIKAGETTKITVTVSNITGADATNVPLSLRAKESGEFDIYPFNETFTGRIANLSEGTSREVAFVVNPVGNILPGTYVLVARATVNGEEYEKESVLTVQQ